MAKKNQFSIPRSLNRLIPTALSLPYLLPRGLQMMRLRPRVFDDAELRPLDQLVDVVAHLGAHDLARSRDLKVLRKLQVPA